MLTDEIQMALSLYSNEFDEKEGGISCDMTVDKKHIEALKEFLPTLTIEHGKWMMIECETCREQHDDNFAHLSLETFKHIKWIESQDEYDEKDRLI